MIGPVREVASADELATELDAGALGARAAIALIGGADFTDEALVAALRGLFETIATACESSMTAVVDGGTDSGVMRLMAEARAATGGTFPLIGVAPAGAFDRSTRTGAAIELAHDHSLILLVPGSTFGEETPWLFAAADRLHGGRAPTLVVNGGNLARHEAEGRLAAGGVVLAVAGSGRAADELAASLEADAGLRASGRLRTIPLTIDAAGLARGLAG